MLFIDPEGKGQNVANPNPSPATRFKKGQSGNPGGKTEGQRAAEIEAARISAELRLQALSSLQEAMGAGSISGANLELILNPATLKLFKDSEDRAHGTPKQAVDHTSSDGSMSPAKPSDVDPSAVKSLVDKLTD